MIFLERLMSCPEILKARQDAEALSQDAPRESIGDMRVDRSEELLKDRFLCKGGGMLLVGPTGVGKSSMTMQLLMSWALGRGCFGIDPVRPLTSLLIQAENDPGDLAEQRDGVLAGLEFTDDEKATIFQRLWVVNEHSKCGDVFIARLAALMAEEAPDIVVIDPALAFIGGDASTQKDVGPFLRNKLNPIIKKYGVAVIIVHHTNKPMRGKDSKDSWKAGDLAYLGSGSAEWANWARAVVGFQRTDDYEKFILIAAKRGRQLAWTDENGKPCREKGAVHGPPGTMCWFEVPLSEVKKGEESGKEPMEQKIADLWTDKEEKLTKDEFVKRGKQTGTTLRTVQRWWKVGVDKKVIKIGSDGTAKLTGKFVPQVAVSDDVAGVV